MARIRMAPVAMAGGLLLLALLLNPSAERHRNQIRESIGERSPIAGALGIGSVAAFASRYRSLGVASYTRAGERILSVGAFGFVYVPD